MQLGCSNSYCGCSGDGLMRVQQLRQLLFDKCKLPHFYGSWCIMCNIAGMMYELYKLTEDSFIACT